MKVRIYAMTHKAFIPPKDEIYVPMQVGSLRKNDDNTMGCAADLGFLKDAEEETIAQARDGANRETNRQVSFPTMKDKNIAIFNPYYSELSGLFRVFRSDCDSEILGLCHYRRYLQNAAHRLFDRAQIEQILSQYDIMTTKKVILDHSYLEGFSGKHHAKDLIETGKVILCKYPDYYEEFERVIHQNTTYFGNMLIASRELFMDYCEWLFTILFEVHRRIDMNGYNDYQKRVFGFISEVLLMVYCNVKHLKVLECDVAVFGEKKETEETKRAIAKYFEMKDLQGAQEYFMKIYQKRPDILMEASDTKGELKLCMQLITMFLAEKEQMGTCYLDYENHLETLLSQCRRLNRILLLNQWCIDNNNQENSEVSSDLTWLLEREHSNVAIHTAIRILYPKNKERQDSIYKRILQLRPSTLD